MYRLYRPITATPFQANASYREYAPCEALKPYIRCFWGTAEPVTAARGGQGLVIPDTCMDILFDLNYTKNTCSDCFCGINDRAFCSLTAASGDTVATFAIRFYPWTAALFAEDASFIRATRNSPDLNADTSSAHRGRTAPGIFPGAGAATRRNGRSVRIGGKPTASSPIFCISAASACCKGLYSGPAHCGGTYHET